MGEQPRDWDKEMAAIDKIMAAGPPAPAPVPTRPSGRVPTAPAGATPGATPRGLVPGRYAVLFTWLRLALGLGLGAAMTQWPYTHGCGLPLVGYLGAVAAVLLAGAWSSVSSWRTRSGFAHVLAMALIVWGGVLAGREVLPRIGYAKESAAWVCAAPGATSVVP